MKNKKAGGKSKSADAFPAFPMHKLISAKPGKKFQVLAGDKNHWRVGLGSPAFDRRDQITELEKHSCPEMFLLLKGNVTMVMDDGKGERELILKPMKPVMVSCWHRSYCPDGPHTGMVLIVERDDIRTVFRPRLTK